jgi:predicted site-specific integrase-resolvase
LAHVAQWQAGSTSRTTPHGTVIVHPPKIASVESVAIYARVSGADQKADLERRLVASGNMPRESA